MLFRSIAAIGASAKSSSVTLKLVARSFSSSCFHRADSSNSYKSNATMSASPYKEWLFNDVLDATKKEQILYLWQNGPAVVIGKHQNPWKECRIPTMEEDKVTLVRRYSGGGAVYHDLGNGVFSFLSPKTDHDIKRNLGIVCGALKRLNINAEPSGRNDITVDGKKISGSAFKNAKDKSIHHGTFLYDVNMNALGKYLTPSRAKLLSKGVTSVQARVTNIHELNPSATFDQVNDALIAQFLQTYGESGTVKVEELSPAKLSNIPSLKKSYDLLNDWEWRFGKTPEFAHHLETRFDWGQFDLYLESRNGLIEKVKIYSDSLNPTLVEELQKALVGVQYSAQGVAAASVIVKAALDSADPATNAQVDEFSQWLAKAL